MGRNNQSTQPDTTSQLQLEDETVATNRATTVIPLTQGECKTTIRWCTPIYGSYQAQNPYSNQGGKK